MEDKNSRSRLSSVGGTQHQRDPSTSSGRNVLSNTSISPEPRPLPRSSFDDNHNAEAYLTTVPNHGQDASVSQRRRSGSGSRPLPQPRPELTAPPPTKSRHHSNTPLGQISVSHTPDKVEGSVSSSGYLPQTRNDFDPYEGIPRSQMPLRPNRRSDVDMVYVPQRHGHSSSVSLPRSPGEPEGQPQRGWSADDEMDRTSLLIDQRPMEIDNGMNGVYIATPRDVTTIGRPGEGPRHWANPSAESFVTVVSSGGDGGRRRNSLRFEPESPTLSMLERDIGNRSGFATYAGRESLSGNSGWDASTQGHGRSSLPSPISHPPLLPNSGSQQPLSSTIDVSSAGVETSGQRYRNHSFSLAGSGRRSASPSPGHIRSGSDVSINGLSHTRNRSREHILSPPRNDPLRLFPDSVRAAGYTIGLGPNAIPIPPRSPRPHEFGNASASASTSTNDGNHSRPEVRGANDDGAIDQRRGRTTTTNRLTGSGPLAGYVERDREQQSGGGTWGTESSGVQTILEAVQQLPEYLNVRSEGTATPLGIESRTPPGYPK
jgi:hypothetical protein